MNCCVPKLAQINSHCINIFSNTPSLVPAYLQFQQTLGQSKLVLHWSLGQEKRAGLVQIPSFILVLAGINSMYNEKDFDHLVTNIIKLSLKMFVLKHV